MQSCCAALEYDSRWLSLDHWRIKLLIVCLNILVSYQMWQRLFVVWLLGEDGWLYSDEALSLGAVHVHGCVLPVLLNGLLPSIWLWIITIKDGCVCAVKVMPKRLTLACIPNSPLVFIKHTGAKIKKGKHSSGSLVCAKKKKGGVGEVELRSRSPAFLNHVSLWLCHYTCVLRSLDFDTTGYWWNWVLVLTSLRGEINRGGLLHVHLPFQCASSGMLLWFRMPG